MEQFQPSLANALRSIGGALLFLIPGWMATRRWASPAPLISAVLVSVVVLFEGSLLLDSLGRPLDLLHFALVFALASALFAFRLQARSWWCWPRAPLARKDAIWLVPIGLALACVIARAVIDPLPGYDNGTRWDYLARLFLRQQSLQGYPPVTAVDFERYSWCDGIPPLVPLLNLWMYLASGTTAPGITSWIVVSEALLLATLVFRLSRVLWGETTGWGAVAALSSSCLALWSVMLGQETGVTAISLVAMIYFLELRKRESGSGLVIWAAIAAAVGALTREYALSFPVLGCALLGIRHKSPRDCLVFALIAFGLAAPWYVRNLAITGNPLYPQTLGGFFPGNTVHDLFMADIAETWSLTRRPALRYLCTLLATIAGLVTILGFVGLGKLGRRSGAVFAAMLLLAVLWVWSIPQTAAGWVYSSRLLLPAVALLAALSGWIDTLSIRWRRLAAFLVLAVTADALHRSWVMPNLPFAPVRWNFSDWREIRDDTRAIGGSPIWEALVRAADGKGIVVDHTANHALITMQGGRAVALFSPALHRLAANDVGVREGIATLENLKIRFVVFTSENLWLRNAPISPMFWSKFQTSYRPLLHQGGLVVYDVASLNPQ